MMLDIYMDHIILEGRKITRPSNVPRSKWMKDWERVKALMKW